MGKTEQIASLILFNIFFIFFIVAVILFIRQYRIKKKEHQDTLFRQKVEHQKELLATQLEIQLDTMQLIGREIHDNIGQKLTLSRIYLQQLEFENKCPVSAVSISNVSAIIKDSLTDLRELSKNLTSDKISKTPFIDLLKLECSKINELQICEVNFQTNVEKLELNYQSKLVLYRVVQEFFQNSIKHSLCKHINLIVHLEAGVLELKLGDDGKGFDKENKDIKGIGLKNIRKRIELIKGSLDLKSNSNGTVLIIKVKSMSLS